MPLFFNTITYVYRNPWGKGRNGNWEGAWSDGSKEFTADAQIELNHKFGTDSVFWISYEDLLRKYQHVDRTRLFMDSPDWRLSQKWISVEVPWHAEFEQRFRIVLTKESPVVLVLSQLDHRYFYGLQGQFGFRLQFRLHEVNSPGEEDYIVRSHGNYLMERSVVTELKSLPAGTYSVFVMVVADRDTNILSVEEVVKKLCRGKAENNKLIQVGMEYDLAHKKVAAHMASKAAIRQAQEKDKGKKEIMAIRRKNWAKSQLSRNILRKQYKKDREKRDKKTSKPDEEAGEGAERRRQQKPIHSKEHNALRWEREREDKAIQTEDSYKTAVSEAEGAQLPTKDNDKGVQTEDMSASFTASQDTIETPPSGQTSPRPTPLPVDGQGPSHDRGRRRSYSRRDSRDFPRRHQYITSEGDSSASPVSAFEDLYSDDDHPSRALRMPLNGGDPPHRNSHKKGRDSEDDEPEPWNAICIVGLRVYSKDEGLDLMIFEEGFDDVEKPEELKVEDPGTDGDVEDCGDDEPEKGEGAEKSKDKVAAVKDSGDIRGKKTDVKGEAASEKATADKGKKPSKN